MSIITVTSNADNGTGSLRAAIAGAQAGDTIQFDSSLANQTIALTSGQINIDKSLTVDGANSPGLTISGNQSSRIFSVGTQNTDFKINNLTLANGLIQDDLGGAVWTTDHVNLTVNNCQFNNNVSRGGGAIFAYDYSNVNVTNSKFNQNDGATYGNLEISGGAISTGGKCDLNIKGSEFTNNKGINGGAVYSIFSNVNVENSTFLNNDSSAGAAQGSPTSSIAGYTRGYGGAIYVDGASRSNDPRFYANAAIDGDAVGGTIRIANSVIEGNKAAGEGGGLFLFGYPQDKVIVEGSQIINNQVVKDNKGDAIGGGIRFGPTQITLDKNIIAGNNAQTQGGGVFYEGESPVNITDNVFANNKAQGDGNTGQGGAVYSALWAQVPENLVNNTFTQNYAGQQAGAIYDSQWYMNVQNSIFDSNTAGDPSNNQTNREINGSNNIEWPSITSSENPATLGSTFSDPNLAHNGIGSDLSFSGIGINGGISASNSSGNATAVDISNNGTLISTSDNGSSKVTPVDTSNNGSGNAIPVDTSNNGSNNGTLVSTSDNGSSNIAPADTSINGSSNVAPVDTSNNGSSNATPVDTSSNGSGNITPVDISSNVSGNAIPVNTNSNGSNNETLVSTSNNSSGNAIPVNKNSNGSNNGPLVSTSDNGSSNVAPVSTSSNGSGNVTPVDTSNNASSSVTPADTSSNGSSNSAGSSVSPVDTTDSNTDVSNTKSNNYHQSKSGDSLLQGGHEPHISTKGSTQDLLSSQGGDFLLHGGYDQYIPAEGKGANIFTLASSQVPGLVPDLQIGQKHISLSDLVSLGQLSPSEGNYSSLVDKLKKDELLAKADGADALKQIPHPLGQH